MLEAPIEQIVSAHAQLAGWLAFKWNSANYRGVPDHIYFKDGVVKIIEFKATGKKATRLQKRIHDKLRAEGFEVHVINDVEDGIALFPGSPR